MSIRSNLFALASSVLLGSPFAIAAEPLQKKTTSPTAITDDVRMAAQNSNEFAIDLFAQIGREKGNAFLSPASISTALAMTYGGAAGQTAEQMAAVLHFELPEGGLHEAYGTLGEILNAENKSYELRMANRLWGAKTFPFHQPFLELTSETYGAELTELDFSRTEEARRTINRWVEEQTDNRIRDLIPPNVLEVDTPLVLTNAIYFKGAWADEFRERATKEAPFHLEDGGEVAAKLMHQTDDFAYTEADGIQLLRLGYAGGDLSMIVLLPREVGVGALEKMLRIGNLTRWQRNLRKREVEVYLPRFKMTSQFQLASSLEAMGMSLAFSDQADFSRMSSAEALKLAEVVHQAFVEVNERGTEAAAATAVIATPTAAPVEEEEPPVVFRADRPFLFLIQDNRTDAILFLGRVSDPTV